MRLAKSRRFRRLLAGSGNPSSRCKRRRKSWVRMKRGSAAASLGSIKQTAGRGGRAEKNSSSTEGSNSSTQSSSSTESEYYGGTGGHERRAQEEITRRWISLVPS